MSPISKSTWTSAFRAARVSPTAAAQVEVAYDNAKMSRQVLAKATAPRHRQLAAGQGNRAAISVPRLEGLAELTGTRIAIAMGHPIAHKLELGQLIARTPPASRRRRHAQKN